MATHQISILNGALSLGSSGSVYATPFDTLTPDSQPAHFAKARAAVRIIEAMDRRADFNLADARSAAAIQAGLAALKTAGLLGDATIAAIIALGTARVSRAAQMGWPDGLKAEDIAYARSPDMQRGR